LEAKNCASHEQKKERNEGEKKKKTKRKEINRLRPW
jgi:hypothetical protein